MEVELDEEEEDIADAIEEYNETNQGETDEEINGNTSPDDMGIL